jgi:hypothetical protein
VSRTACVRQFFGNTKHDFRLRVAELEELEEETGVGYGQIWAEMTPTPMAPFGFFHVKRVRTVLRLALVGGGMDKERAYELVERHAVPPDLGRAAVIAHLALGAVCVGVPEEPLGERKGRGKTTGRRSPTAAPAGATSTKPAARSAGTRKPSAAKSSGSSSKP